MPTGMNSIFPTPNISNSLIHATVCIMNHLTLTTEKKEEQKNITNRNEHNKKQLNIVFYNYCNIKKIVLLKDAVVSDGSQESMFSVAMTNFLLNTDLHALGVTYGNAWFVLFFPKTLSSLFLDIITLWLGFL